MRCFLSFFKLGAILLLLTHSTSLYAQLFSPDGSVRPTSGWPAKVVEIYQPLVSDSTLLLTTPWMVLHCTCGTDSEVEFYYDLDFRCVRKCWGRKEVVDSVEVNGELMFVQRELGQLYATLEADAGGFLYTEVPLDSMDAKKPLRRMQLVFDTDHVVRTDTSTIFQSNSDELITRLTRYVELKLAD